MSAHIRIERHPIDDPQYIDRCRARLDDDGALVLEGFFRPQTVDSLVAELDGRDDEAFYAGSTHNVFLTEPDERLPADHAANREVTSSKGLLADDEIAPDSALREIYGDDGLRRFLTQIVGVDELHPYADEVSSINVHFAPAGRELGWHFDNSSFAVTMLLRAPEAGGRFEYVPDVRPLHSDPDADAEMYRRIDAVLDGAAEVRSLDVSPGSLVLFRGRHALHRVTPTEGLISRILVVFAYNDRPGIALSESALRTFFGRVV